MNNYVIRYQSDGENKTLWLGNVSKDHAELRCHAISYYRFVKNVRLENLGDENDRQ